MWFYVVTHFSSLLLQACLMCIGIKLGTTDQFFKTILEGRVPYQFDRIMCYTHMKIEYHYRFYRIMCYIHMTKGIVPLPNYVSWGYCRASVWLSEYCYSNPLTYHFFIGLLDGLNGRQHFVIFYLGYATNDFLVRWSISLCDFPLFFLF